MNFWRIKEGPKETFLGKGWGVSLELIDNMPIDPKIYCQKPNIDPRFGVKPASLLSMNGVLYLAVELHNYGDNPQFNRQHNINAWIITSVHYGKTWNREATPVDFFTGRLASPHFIQFGKDYQGARDQYVYACFPSAGDGNSYWENGDYLLLGRVAKYDILKREAWEFFTGFQPKGDPIWGPTEPQASPCGRTARRPRWRRASRVT